MEAHGFIGESRPARTQTADAQREGAPQFV